MYIISSTNKEIYKNREEIELEKEDYQKTIKDLVKEHNIFHGLLEPYLVYKDYLIINLEYYYNPDGYIEFNKKTNEIPIKDFKEYGYKINDKIVIDFPDGMGSSTGPFQSFVDLYNQMNTFFINNPLLIEIIKDSLPIIGGLISLLFKRIERQTNTDVFKKIDLS